MADDPATTSAADLRTRRTVLLRDLAVAPENMRFGEPADDEIPQLARTIRAGGVLFPLITRPGRRKEKPHMVLDGRRRLLALTLLLESGDIDDAYAVEVVEETDRARQAAAVLASNTAVPVHVADVVASIGKMLKSKLTVGAIAAAIGYDEADVKKLATLAALHPEALAALRAGRITLKQARLLARVPDAEFQAELAEAALAGFGFQEWRVTERLQEGRVTVLDRRFALVGPERYAAAGGRTESDLFGELPDRLLDPEILQRLWRERAQEAADALAADGLEVHLCDDRGFDPPEGLEPLGYVYANDLTQEALAGHHQAQAVYRDLAMEAGASDLADDGAPERLAALLRAKLACDRAGHPGRSIAAAVIWAAGPHGLEARFYSAAAPTAGDGEDGTASATGGFSPGHAARLDGGDVEAPAVEVDVEGISHALHETRTDMATRGLIRALADDPGAALAALVARLFTVLVLETARGAEASALSVSAQSYRRPRCEPVEALDGEVRRRLAERRAAYKASGLRPIPWAAGLPHGDKMALLADLVALSLDLREPKTGAVRAAARADAADIATLTGADIAGFWTPDEAFLKPHGKKHLLAMLDEMGAADDRARTLKKDDLVALVAERAAERGWAPAVLSWTSSKETAGEGERAAESEAAAADAAGGAVPSDELPAAA
ncbi:MAG TPA: ParB N-terminal domain-containing protein [Caulobacteraceae bacterium]